MHLVFLVLTEALIRPLFLWPIVRVGHAVREFWRAQRSSAWYVDSGTVLGRRARQKGRLWRVWLTYYYTADGRAYPGVWSRLFVFERDVDRFLSAHPKGTLLTLRHCPGRVSRSVVLDVDQQVAPQDSRVESSSAGTMSR